VIASVVDYSSFDFLFVILKRPFVALMLLALLLACHGAEAQSPARNSAPAQPKPSTITIREGSFEIKFPLMLIRCERRDGENPDVWSPEHGCAASIPVCDNAGHSGEVLVCLAYPLDEFRGSELQGAALSVSRLDGYNSASDCAKRWPSRDTRDIHTQRIGTLSLQAATAVERETSHVAERYLYRVFHNRACYELDITLATALPSAFAAEDVPRNMTEEERRKVKASLMEALRSFRFLK
jgi:hypothetical protein